MGNFCKVTDVWQILPYFIRLACHTLFSGNTLSAFLSAILTDQRDLNFPENTPFYNEQDSCKVRANETYTHVENISLHKFRWSIFQNSTKWNLWQSFQEYHNSENPQVCGFYMKATLTRCYQSNVIFIRLTVIADAW